MLVVCYDDFRTLYLCSVFIGTDMPCRGTLGVMGQIRSSGNLFIKSLSYVSSIQQDSINHDTIEMPNWHRQVHKNLHVGMSTLVFSLRPEAQLQFVSEIKEEEEWLGNKKCSSRAGIDTYSWKRNRIRRTRSLFGVGLKINRGVHIRFFLIGLTFKWTLKRSKKQEKFPALKVIIK